MLVNLRSPCHLNEFLTSIKTKTVKEFIKSHKLAGATISALVLIILTSIYKVRVSYLSTKKFTCFTFNPSKQETITSVKLIEKESLEATSIPNTSEATSIPNTSEATIIPNTNEETILPNTNEETSVEREVRKSKVVGKALIYKNADNTPVEILITKGKSRFKASQYEAIIREGNQDIVLGEMRISKIRTLKGEKYGDKQGKFGCESGIDDCDLHAYYGPESDASALNRIYVEDLHSHYKSKYKGIGLALMQVAMEINPKKYEGRVTLEASWNSHGFYYKLGMRSMSFTNSDKHNKIIEKELNLAKKENRAPKTGNIRLGLGSVTMYLPQEAIEKEKVRIQTSPILDKNKGIQFINSQQL